jgi:hypothetical protein
MFQDTPQGGRLITASEETHQKLSNELTKENRCITNREISLKVGISKDKLGHINKFLRYRKVCVR